MVDSHLQDAGLEQRWIEPNVVAHLSEDERGGTTVHQVAHFTIHNAPDPLDVLHSMHYELLEEYALGVEVGLPEHEEALLIHPEASLVVPGLGYDLISGGHALEDEAGAAQDCLFPHVGLREVAHPELVKVDLGVLAAHEGTPLVVAGYAPRLTHGGKVHPLFVFLILGLVVVDALQRHALHVRGTIEVDRDPLVLAEVPLKE